MTGHMPLPPHSAWRDTLRSLTTPPPSCTVVDSPSGPWAHAFQRQRISTLLAWARWPASWC